MSFLLTSPIDQKQKPEQSYFTEIDPKLTTLKNADRIDEIVTELVLQRQETFTTSPIARTVRRDWNIVCAKMYVFALKTEYRALIEEDLAELHFQVGELYRMANIGMFNDVDTNWMQKVTLDLKIVSPLSASWLRALKTWDTCTARLLSAERTGIIDKKMRQKMLQPVIVSYLSFKGTAMKSKPRVTQDMAEQDMLLEP